MVYMNTHRNTKKMKRRERRKCSSEVEGNSRRTESYEVEEGGRKGEQEQEQGGWYEERQIE
jgi:hypothetical protein